MNARVSVIVVARDAEAHVATALDSLVAQTFADWEAVVVVDGDDDTWALASAQAEGDARFRVLRGPELNESAARNVALAASGAEWLAFLDADDRFEPHALERLLSAADDGADLVHAGWVRVLRDGRELAPEYSPEGELFAVLARSPAFTIDVCVVRRALVERVGGFDEQLRVCMDWDLWQRIARAGARFASVREVVARNLVRPGSASSDAQVLLADGLRVIDRAHMPDARVPAPDLRLAQGAPRQWRAGARLAFAATACGYAIGQGEDPLRVLEIVGDTKDPELDADVVASTLVNAVPLGAGAAPADWPDLWVRHAPAIEALLDELERRSTARAFAARCAVALERAVVEAAREARVASAGRTHGVELDLERPCADLSVDDAQRVLLWPRFAGQPVGSVELPVCDGIVPGEVIADAVAARHFWALLGSFFERNVYPGRPLGEGASELDAAERHDRIGWGVFLQELWGLPDWPNERFYALGDGARPSQPRRLGRLGRLRNRSENGWVQVEAAFDLPRLSVNDVLDVVVTLGGVPLGVLRLNGPAELDADALRALITTRGGLELCRHAVREALIGRPVAGGDSLRERLQDGARRWRAPQVPARPAGFELAPVASGLLPGGSMLARHRGGALGTSSSRRAALPAAAAAELDSAAAAAGEPLCLAADAGSTGRLAYVPELIWRADSSAPAGALVTPEDSNGTVALGGRPYDRHRFESLFAAHEDPWDYTSTYEQLKYEQTLSLLPPEPIERALELACAEGHFTVQLAARVGTLVAADVSGIALQRAAARCAHQGNVSFLELDLVSDQVPGGFDLIVCSEVLYYMGDVATLEATARKLAAALAPGGHLITAHARVVQDEPGGPGFDWGVPFGSKTIAAALADAGGLSLVEEIRAPLYRVQRFERAPRSSAAPRVTEIEQPDGTPAAVLADVRWDGPDAAAGEPDLDLSTDRLLILLYHRVAGDEVAPRSRYRVTPEAFTEQLRYLRDAGFSSTTADEWRLAMEARRPLPGRRVLITFDDGYRDFATQAWPLLREHGFGALLFAVTDRVGGLDSWNDGGARVPLLDWDELRRLRDDGVEIGSHSATHPFLTTLTPLEVTLEAARSRAALAEALGQAPTAFAYPYGVEDPGVRQLVGGCGYAYGFSVRAQPSRYTDDLLALPRIEITGQHSLADFVATLSGAEVSLALAGTAHRV